MGTSVFTVTPLGSFPNSATGHKGQYSFGGRKNQEFLEGDMATHSPRIRLNLKVGGAQSLGRTKPSSRILKSLEKGALEYCIQSLPSLFLKTYLNKFINLPLTVVKIKITLNAKELYQLGASCERNVH